MRSSLCLLRQLPHLASDFTFSPRSPAIYALGLSYASKYSPPFVQESESVPKYGYAGYKGNDPGATLIAEWVRSSMERTAGRGDLSATKPGGWDATLQEKVKKWGAGEDFFAVVDLEATPSSSPTPEDPPVHLAISDGVGGWSDVVDPSFFSQALMYHYAKSSLRTDEPRSILKSAYEGVLGEETVVAGSATACGVTVDSKGILRGVNLGDSGCLIIRDSEVVFETPSLTHYFNCPTQLSKIPKGMGKDNVIMDLPDDKSSDTFTAQLQPGDMVLLYTDGLSDNVPSSHLPRLLSHIRALLATPDNAHLSVAERDVELARLFADVLVGYGRRAMLRTGDEEEGAGGQESWKTPFHVESEKAGLAFRGGKVDDITVMAAVVGELHPESD